MSKTYVVCSVCGRVEKFEQARKSGWLVAASKRGGGRMVIRCPRHITRYARKQAHK